MKVITLTALAAAAGLATASPIMNTGLTSYAVDTAGTPTQTIVVDISGMSSNDELGNAINQVITLNLGVGAEVTGLGWDVTLSTVGGSWASEATMDFGGQIFLTVGVGDDFTVSNAAYASGGILDLSDNALPNIVTDGAGDLRIELFEGFVDNAGSADAIYGAGSTISLAVKGVPAPGSLAVLGLGGIVAGRRRR